MAQQNSFDVTTGVDLQEVDNAVNQATKEIAQRYDFKGTNCTVELDRGKNLIRVDADDEYRLTAVLDVLRTKLHKRGVPLKNLKESKLEQASLGRVRQELTLTQGIPSDTAKEIARAIKDRKMKNVQVSIQGDQLRVTSPSRDALQETIAFLKSEDYGVELNFGNYR